MKIGPAPSRGFSASTTPHARYRLDNSIVPRSVEPDRIAVPKAASRTVYVIDGDLMMHDTIRWSLESSGVRVIYCSSPDAFLSSYSPGTEASCILLDVKLPGCTGPDLQDQLLGRGVEVPIIFVSACKEIATAVRVMKRGAFDFVEKPFQLDDLLQRVEDALECDQERLNTRDARRRMEQRLQLLSDREREVMDLVVTGLTSSQIASRLFITRKTVECHRLRIMRKMGADNVPQLVFQLYSIGSLQVRDRLPVRTS